MRIFTVFRVDNLNSSVTIFFFFFFNQKTAYYMRISDWSSDVCSSDLVDVVDDEADRLERAGHVGGLALDARPVEHVDAHGLRRDGAGRQAAEDVEDRLGLGHERALDRGAAGAATGLGRDAVADQLVGVEAGELATEGDEVAGVEVLVEPHVVHSGRDELVERAEVGEPAAHGLGDGAAPKDLLAGDATEVGGAVAHPVAVVGLVLAVPGAHNLAGRRTVATMAARH